jgi:RNA polymerase sigma factor (sigma-70 family)
MVNLPAFHKAYRNPAPSPDTPEAFFNVEGCCVDSHQELNSLLQRIRVGSQDAARELWQRYEPHVRRVLRRKLNKKLRTKLDSVDLAQDVWISFFVDPRHQFEFDQPEDLIAFLATLAQNKLVDTLRRHATQKYAVSREQPLADETGSEVVKLIDPGPSPSQVIMAEEAWEKLLEGQSPQSQRILNRLRQGRTQQEVAQEIGVSERTVRRLVRKIAPESST